MQLFSDRRNADGKVFLADLEVQAQTYQNQKGTVPDQLILVIRGR